MLRHYIKIAFRNLWKYKTQSIIGIIGLAVGVFCFILCLYDPIRSLEEYRKIPDGFHFYNLSAVDENDLRQLSEVKEYTYNYYYIISGKIRLTEEENEVLYPFQFQSVDNNFLDFFSLRLLYGDEAGVMGRENSMVLFESTAKKITNNPQELIGKTVVHKDDDWILRMIDEFKETGRDISFPAYTITAIVEDPVFNVTYFPEGLLFNEFALLANVRDKNAWVPYVKLNDNVPEEVLAEKLRQLSEKRGEEITFFKFEKSISFSLFSVILLIFGILLIFIALFNYFSFYIVQFYNRLKEFALSKVCGGQQRHIFSQFYVETVLGLLIAFVLAFLFLEVLFPFIRDIFQGMFSIQLDPNKLRVYLLGYVVCNLLLFVVLCFIPARQINNRSIRSVLLGGSQKGRKQYMRDMMLFFQLLITGILLMSAMVVWMQTNKVSNQLFTNISKKERKQIFSIQARDMLLEDKPNQILASLRSSPLVDASTLMFWEIIQNHQEPHLKINGFDDMKFETAKVESGFFEFFNGRIVLGRTFEPDEDDAVVINRKFADLYGEDTPIGRTFTDSWGRFFRIVGVVEDLQLVEYYSSVGRFDKRNYADDYPMFYYPSSDRMDFYTVYVRAGKGREKEVRKLLESSVNEYMQNIPDSFRPKSKSFSEELTKLLSTEITLYNTLVFFFVICLMLGLLSIYSSILLSTEKRLKEIAIRKINGAGIKDIILLFSKTYVLLWTTTFILALPVVYFLGEKWLQNYTDRIQLSFFVFLVLYLLVLILVLFTIAFRILKVARTNPVKTLKN